ncbi:VWA domain-containing protein [Nitrobacter winogradskyi]|uniref:Membrane protein n=2 Tax=Nitrobacter winogradskyi TaxID=913 RepID=A0A4Y3WGW9_NITWI|nr:VWA domain-containing protein [Nitrobacter winogradskyi]MCP2001226.1 Ca-activated chloride channel family protein [Nitrobacter winogradskyi]GEC17431.1 membrane protein [Nitrobacter winogradskyi]
MAEAAPFAFHFLRPLWFLAALPVIGMTLYLLTRQNMERQWGRVIAPELLKHLLVRPEKGWRLNPVYLVATGHIISIVALAGPTWRRELPPFVEDKAPLMIVLSVSPSMNTSDIAPTRLERAKQKVHDLLAARVGARTGLVAYSGSAHLVMPLTDDRTVIEPFLASLTTNIMPKQGNDAVAAVSLAADYLLAEPAAGTILLIADDLAQGTEAAVIHAASRNGLTILGMAAPSAALPESLSDAVKVTVDDGDIRALQRRVETRYQSAQAAAFGTRWQDEGFWLVIPAALFALLWFRRGVVVPWILLLALCRPQAASAAESDWFRNLWLTPDQQGRIAFDRGDYASAKMSFDDPMWRGIAAYRAYDYLAAAESFRRINSPEGRFALGDAEAHNHAYEKAIQAYDDVLAVQPNNVAAIHNKAIVQVALEAREKKRREQEQANPEAPDLKADETKVDPNQKEGKKVVVPKLDVTSPGAVDAWMRQVETSPADFLRQKFAIQAAAAPRLEPKP